jgi:ketosteroid isomerase-like protein
VAANIETARAFFEACETGKGWAGCAQYCHADATFSAQSGAIVNIVTLADYTEWMKGLLGILPDGAYELTAFAEDAARETIVASAIFTGTHTGDGGPVPPTGHAAKSDYAYVIKLSDGKVSHMTKIWNDGWALKQLGWA